MEQLNINLVSQNNHFPEKILQFGTGVLLRGLCDFVVDKANKEGLFEGKIVIVKSTDGGDSNAFSKQNCLYTVCESGIEARKLIERNTICSPISRVLSAKNNWKEILEFAQSPDLKIVISNTTEAGIQLVNESIQQSPPESFPAKLLAILYHRYQYFNGNVDRGLTIVPTELIPNNGDKLQNIVFELAHLNNLEASFIDWLEKCTTFCNSLVDRIVPGSPDAKNKEILENKLGYKDDLLTTSEPYLLWAIQGDEKVKNTLSFANAHAGVIIEHDIDKYRELKLRMLNGTHTLSCGVAFLAGFKLVKDAMQDEQMAIFIKNLMLEDIASGIPYEMDSAMVQNFGNQVLDRFQNPSINHQWLSITMNFSSKMLMRNIPTLLNYYKKYQKVPVYIAKGFAGYLNFMKPVNEENGKYYGKLNNEYYLIQDIEAPYFMNIWKNNSTEKVVKMVLANQNLWETDLNELKGFSEEVIKNM